MKTPTNDLTEKPVIGTRFYRTAKPGSFGRAEWLDLFMACQNGHATCMRVLEIVEREMDLRRPDVDLMVDAFLSWPLPESVHPDSCVLDSKYPHRYGTNLLTAIEAKQMIEHILANAGSATAAHAKALEALSFSRFEHVLRKHSLIDPSALDDPEGFDNYRTHGRVHAAHRELIASAPATTGKGGAT